MPTFTYRGITHVQVGMDVGRRWTWRQAACGVRTADCSALGAPVTCAQCEPDVATGSRCYVIGLPVVVTVHDDGRVTAEVDLSEAADLWEASTPDGQANDDATVGSDVTAAEKAVEAKAVVVSA